jgi:hypothetical protein
MKAIICIITICCLCSSKGMTQKTFQISIFDTSRTYLVKAKDLQQKLPSLFRTSLLWNEQMSETQNLQNIESMITSHPPTTPPKTVMLSPLVVVKPYQHRWGLHFNVGGWQQDMTQVSTLDTITYINLADYHTLIGLQTEYNLNDTWSAFVEVNWLFVPKEKEIKNIQIGGGSGISVDAQGKGGAVFPYHLGLRCTPVKNEVFRLHFSSFVGQTLLFLGGGKAGIKGGNRVQKQIQKRQDTPFSYGVGAGFDIRISPITAIRVNANYHFSEKVNNDMGSIKRFQGLMWNVGLLFLIGKGK